MKRPALRALVLPTALLLAPALTGTAVAAPGSTGPAAPAATEPAAVLATDLLTPLTLAAGDGGAVWFTQNFGGSLSVLSPGQDARRLFQARNNLEVGGVSVGGDRVWFTLSGRQETYGKLLSIKPGGGTAKVVADLADYENAKNPDGDERFGFRNLSASCAAKFTGAKTPSYLGKTQTHPYATLHVGRVTYVADAAANAVLKVKRSGKVSTVAVLPGVKTRMTRAYAKQHNLPRCTVGKKYVAEPVPTDVVAGPDGTLYVTTLPGGPAGEGGQARGAGWKAEAAGKHQGRLTKVATDLDTPTGLTIAPNGDLYVAELFGNQIVRIPAGGGTAVPFAQVPFPGDVLATSNGLIASVNVLSGTSGKNGDPVNGSIERFGY